MAHEGKRILLVSNRLPVTIKNVDGGTEFVPSSGGLATALRSLDRNGERLWIGWPGVVPHKERREVERRLTGELQCIPVFMSERLTERYYEGFSNRTVWPLFHSFPSATRYSAQEWEAYQDANMRFCDRIMKIARPDDTIWVQDYQLMLLPEYLRERLPDASIGFFLHIPFPHYEILRLLPRHKEIMNSLLNADLIGFHTHDYAQEFLGGVRRLLGYNNTLGQLMVGTRIVQVDVFPIGIDFRSFSESAGTPDVLAEITRTRETVKEGKLIFSVSRLDYTKGIPQSLTGFETLLQTHPEWQGKVVYLLVVVPSRERVERYASLKREIDELIGKINSKYGTLNWTPIRYIYRNLPFPELVALYGASDVALITPLRDGMNLIAKEYVASRNDEQGVLVLSEMAGAAQEMLEALIVIPHDQDEMAQAIRTALDMPPEEQARRNRLMRQRLEAYDVHWWVKKFVTRLEEVRAVSKQLQVKILDEAARRQLEQEFAAAERRMIILDYDGTLVPFAGTPDLARPDTQLLEDLSALQASPGTRVVILSSRERHSLERWFGALDIMLVAEHGAWMRERKGAEWVATVTESQDFWKKEVRPMFELYVDRIPGSFIEEKDFSLVWHYRRASVEAGWNAAKDLLDTLSNVAANLGVQVLPGNKAIELKTSEMSKGLFF
ncbi:bifunctional alpha,alpha-trehalose-phosphate synthase (UDP-forming)/trehalose-phosphatase, partial [bacterium]